VLTLTNMTSPAVSKVRKSQDVVASFGLLRVYRILIQFRGYVSMS